MSLGFDGYQSFGRQNKPQEDKKAKSRIFSRVDIIEYEREKKTKKNNRQVIRNR